MERRSFSLTAAGQSWSYTRFPIKPERMPRRQSRNTTYRASRVQVNKMLWSGVFVNASRGLLRGRLSWCTRAQ
jgi:hypothetical protein